MKHFDLDQFPTQVSPETVSEHRATLETGTGRLPGLVLTFVIMMILWVVLSGRLDAFHLSLGVLSSAIVAHYSWDLLFRPGLPFSGWGGTSLRMAAYLPWLLWQIVLANIHVLKLALGPNLPDRLDPHLIRFETRCKSDFSIVTFANSITLTPGTITVVAGRDGRMVVHAIDRQMGDMDGLRAMETKVLQVFREEENV